MRAETRDDGSRSGKAPRYSLALALAVALPCSLPHPSWAQSAVERGKLIFALAAGCGCHTPPDGPVGAGGGKVPTPFGTFYGPNITPDPDTGIGRWSDAEIRAAIRDGFARGEGVEAPTMPYYYYAGMSDADVDDLIAYLRSLPAARREDRSAEGELPLARLAYRMWRFLFVRHESPPATAPRAEELRGRYLVDHISLCVDCHTPRDRLGVPERSMYLAGVARGPEGEVVPNITPDGTGIRDWDTEDMYNVLTTGMLPNFDNVQGAMADVVNGHGGGPGLKDAPEGDLRAIAAYLKTVPAIDNAVEDK
jgi:mono/diheme cytochrome c family protein